MTSCVSLCKYCSIHPHGKKKFTFLCSCRCHVFLLHWETFHVVPQYFNVKIAKWFLLCFIEKFSSDLSSFLQWTSIGCSCLYSGYVLPFLLANPVFWARAPWITLHCLLPWMNSATTCPRVQMGEVKPTNYLDGLKNISSIPDRITKSISQPRVQTPVAYEDKQYNGEIIRWRRMKCDLFHCITSDSTYLSYLTSCLRVRQN